MTEVVPILQQRLREAPDAPGVYLMRAGDEVVYVGKAKSLQARLRAYATGSDNRAFVPLLADLLTDVEVVLTGSEKEALLLEDQLIKRHQPRFNVKLTDDKRFLCLRLDTRQTYPRLELVRRFGEDGARYFGPYHAASAIRESLRIINRHFQLRTCSDEVMHHRHRPCLQHQIHRCPAPCVFDVREEYARNTANVVAFLEGRPQDLLGDLRRRMKEHAERLEFEAAARLRDQIRAVERSMERQQVVSPERIDRDVVGVHREGPAVEIHVLRTREGRLQEPARFSLDDVEVPTGEVLADFAMRYYGENLPAGDVPPEILFPPAMEWAAALGEVLTERCGRRVRVSVPQRGDKRRQVELSCRNAAQARASHQRQTEAAQAAAARLRKALHLQRDPERIECVDISHLQGSEIVASVVRLERGLPNKSRYRTYKVRSLAGQDDFQSMYEVVSRRARRGLEESDLPDLLVIDGGKGQLAAARAALDDHGIDGIDLVALAKSKVIDDGGATPSSEPAARSPERVFVHGQKNPVVLGASSAELFLLTRARDEAHRFAVGYHRRRRRKSATRTVLDSIAGIGPKRRQALLRTFGSVARLRGATFEEVTAVVGAKAARAVLEGLGGARASDAGGPEEP